MGVPSRTSSPRVCAACRSDREISVLEVAKYVQRHFPRSAIEFLPSPPQDPTNRRPDLALANRVIPGWAAGIAYEDGIDRTIEWFRRRMDRTGDRAPQL